MNATLVLSIGETVEEVTDSGFLGTTPTLSCSLLGDDALLQVIVYFINSLNNFENVYKTTNSILFYLQEFVVFYLLYNL